MEAILSTKPPLIVDLPTRGRPALPKHIDVRTEITSVVIPRSANNFLGDLDQVISGRVSVTERWRLRMLCSDGASWTLVNTSP